MHVFQNLVKSKEIRSYYSTKSINENKTLLMKGKIKASRVLLHFTVSHRMYMSFSSHVGY